MAVGGGGVLVGFWWADGFGGCDGEIDGDDVVWVIGEEVEFRAFVEDVVGWGDESGDIALIGGSVTNGFDGLN